MFSLKRGKFNVIRFSLIILLFLFVIRGLLITFWENREISMLVLAICFICMVALIIYLNVAQIIVNEYGIEYRSKFRKGFIAWECVNYFGIHSYSGRSYTEIPKEKTSKFTFGMKAICISKCDKSIPLHSQKLGIDYITFGYNKEIFGFISSKLSVH